MVAFLSFSLEDQYAPLAGYETSFFIIPRFQFFMRDVADCCIFIYQRLCFVFRTSVIRGVGVRSDPLDDPRL